MSKIKSVHQHASDTRKNAENPNRFFVMASWLAVLGFVFLLLSDIATAPDAPAASLAYRDSMRAKSTHKTGCTALRLDRASGTVIPQACDLALPQLPDDVSSGREDLVPMEGSN